jgi:class 3 adenylate cyclase
MTMRPRAVRRPGKTARPPLARVRERFAAVLEWKTVDRVLLLAVIGTVFVGWYAIVAAFVLAHPEVAPYVDLPQLERAFKVALALCATWLALAVAAVAARARWPEARILVYAVVQLYALSVLVAARFLGTHTTLLVGTIVLGGSTIGLVMLEARPVLLGIAMTVLGLVGLTVAEQWGLVAYAPMFTEAPFAHGRLSTAWFVGLGVVGFVALLVQLGIIIFIIQRWREREEMLARANDIISRYVASQLAAQIRAGNYDDLDRYERRKLTLLFVDVQGFSEIADQVEPEDLAGALNDYLSAMTVVAEQYGATIDKFVGDAIMIFFGAPVATNDRDHALRAVRMAAAMQEQMETLREKWQRDGFPRPFHIRIGVNTGQASIGNFGSKHRLDYTAIGRQVNLAARLQTHCSPDRILVSHSTWTLIEDEIPCMPMGEITVKGFQRPVAVYEVEPSRPGVAAGPG